MARSAEPDDGNDEPTPRSAATPATDSRLVLPASAHDEAAGALDTPDGPSKKPAAQPANDGTRAGKEAVDIGSLARTRAAAAWLATGAALIILILLIVLILQNQAVVEVRYMWFSGSIPLGTALLIAAVAGATVVMIIGVVRLTQVRINTRRAQKAAAASKKG